MANNPLESADNKYYAAKHPLYLRGTKEGRKSPAPSFSYKQKANDTTSSSNKYYAAQEQPVPVKPAAIKQAGEKRFRFQASDKVLQDVVGGFQGGGTVIEIAGAAVDITKARAAIDLAVGRNTLTREQADAVTFITEHEHSETPAEVELPKKKTTKKKTTKKKVTKKAKKKTPRKKTKKAEDIVASVLVDNLSDETKAEVLKGGWEDDDDITEKDVAAAFGVTDGDDDDDDSDD